MSEQIELSFAPERSADPAIAQLEEFLHGKDWLSAKEIAAAAGINDRTVRELASASDFIISSPGKTGYRYLFDVTIEEYLEYRNRRRSQAKKMIAKVVRTDRIFFSRLKSVKVV